MIQSLPLQVYEELRTQYSIPKHPSITSPEDVMQVKSVVDLATKQVEYFTILTLNAASEVIKSHTITKGLLNHSLVHPREVFRSAIKDNAHSIIAIHNHPSGSHTPSSADLEVTTQLKNAGEIIGITLLDHLIITTGGVSSLRQLGYI